MNGFLVSSADRANGFQSQRENKGILFVSCRVCAICLVQIAFLIMASCAPPFSSLQSARTAGKGKGDVTPFFSTVMIYSDGESDHVQNDYGFHTAYGIGEMLDLQVRYEFIDGAVEDFEASANVIGIGPKVGLYKGMIAFALPVGFAFGSDIDVSETWQFHPTLLLTLPVGNILEFNPSGKVLIPLSGDGDVLPALNFGAGISTNLRKWAVRPEIGFLLQPGDEGHYTHFSLGVTFYP